MSWKRNIDGDELYFSFDEGPHKGHVVAHVYPGVSRGKECFRWEGRLPDTYDRLDLDMDGWHGKSTTEEAAQEAAEDYLRRKGLL